MRIIPMLVILFFSASQVTAQSSWQNPCDMHRDLPVVKSIVLGNETLIITTLNASHVYWLENAVPFYGSLGVAMSTLRGNVRSLNAHLERGVTLYYDNSESKPGFIHSSGKTVRPSIFPTVFDYKPGASDCYSVRTRMGFYQNF